MQKLKSSSRFFPLTLGADAKTKKGTSLGYATGILYLAPDNQAGFGTVCPFASKGCSEACLYTAGRGKMSSVQRARINKTRLFFTERKSFIDSIIGSIGSLSNYVKKKGYIPVIRLNGTSDIPWEKHGILQAFPDVQFYDYTKIPQRVEKWLKGELPSNYHLTFSMHESNGDKAIELLKLGANVAIVFSSKKGEELPKTWKGFEVVDGDKSDLRFLDGENVVVGLRAKGDAKKDTSGFVVHV